MAAKPERASWRKVWTSFYSTPSHVALDALALHVGVVVIVHASWSPTQDTDDAVLLDGKGLPMSRANLARLCRLTEKVIGRCIDDLVEAGTLELVGGTLVVPRFRRWQETADAARKRRIRSADSPPGQSDIFPRQAEADAEADEEQPPDPRKRGNPRREGKAEHIAIADRVLARLSKARIELKPSCRPIAPSDTMRKQILERLVSGDADEDLLHQVVNARFRVARANPDEFGKLNAATPFRAANWAWSLQLVDEQRGRSTVSPGRNGGGTGALAEQRRAMQATPEQEAEADEARRRYLAGEAGRKAVLDEPQEQPA